MNRVFESFVDFTNSQYEIINENKSEITIEEMLNFMEALIVKQKALVDQSKIVIDTFGKNTKNPLDGYKAYIDVLREKKNMSSEEYNDYLRSDSGKSAYKMISARYAVYAWDNISDQEKKELASNLIAQANEREFKSIKELDKMVKNKEKISELPFIGVMPDYLKLPASKIPMEEIEETLLLEEEETMLFKDNRYKMEDDSFASEEIKDNLIGRIRELLLEVRIGTTNITSIDIHSSSSRYRNTGEEIPTLSWGELSFQRSFTLAKIFFEVAKEIGYSKTEIEKIREKIRLNFYGENGDGTSGPNPPKGFKSGYYDNKSKFIRDDNRDKVIIYSLDNEGKPIKEEKSLEKEPLETGDDYQKFKYVNILIKGESVRDETIPEIPIGGIEIDENIIMGKLPYNGEPGKTPKSAKRPKNTNRKNPFKGNSKSTGCPKPAS